MQHNKALGPDGLLSFIKKIGRLSNMPLWHSSLNFKMEICLCKNLILELSLFFQRAFLNGELDEKIYMQ
jgi:hypothetical protein